MITVLCIKISEPDHIGLLATYLTKRKRFTPDMYLSPTKLQDLAYPKAGNNQIVYLPVVAKVLPNNSTRIKVLFETGTDKQKEWVQLESELISPEPFGTELIIGKHRLPIHLVNSIEFDHIDHTNYEAFAEQLASLVKEPQPIPVNTI